MKTHVLAGLGLALLLTGCSKDNTSDDTDDGMPPKETDCADEVFIDASSMDVWIYYNLETQKVVTPANPADSTEWDLAFQRFKVMSNGGSSGTGGVEVAQVLATACNDLLDAPSNGYLIDAADGSDEGDVPDYAMSFGPSSETGPWGYDPMTHQLFDSGSVFVVKSVEGNYFKLDFFEYYGPTGDSAQLTFRFNTVKAPEEVLPPGVIEVESSLRGYTYLDITDGVITPADPDTSTEWDVAVSGPAWRSNGGQDRAGIGGVRRADSGDFDAITTAPTIGYRIDAEIPYPGPPGSGMYVGNPVLVDWYDYDMTTHLATPKPDVVFLVRGGDGSYGKLQLLEYDGMSLTYRLKIAPVTKTITTESATIDASDGAAFTYFSLRLGETVDVDDPSTSMDWDLGLSRTRFKTNGGTSGPGNGAAVGPIAQPLEQIVDPTTATFAEDAMIDDPEAPGTQFSGNPALAGWFALTGTSTTPKDVAYVVRTADGGYSKMKVTAWADGTFSINHAYAGAGASSF